MKELLIKEHYITAPKSMDYSWKAALNLPPFPSIINPHMWTTTPNLQENLDPS